MAEITGDSASGIGVGALLRASRMRIGEDLRDVAQEHEALVLVLPGLVLLAVRDHAEYVVPVGRMDEDDLAPRGVDGALFAHRRHVWRDGRERLAVPVDAT